MGQYIDDKFFVWTHWEDELYMFLERLNSIPNVKFTSECSRQEINFLDVIEKLNNNQSVIDLYCKLSDCPQYLHYNSYHPQHMKKYSVCSRIKRLYSEDTY